MHFVSRRRFAAGFVLWVALGAHCFAADKTQRRVDASVPGATWETASPESFGWNRKKLERAMEYAGEIGSTSAMIVQHGKIVAQVGDIAHRSNLHSCRKSLLSALIGIAVQRGQLHLDESLAQMGIDDNPPSLTEREKTATLREMIEARSGVYHPTVYETKGMAANKPRRGSHDPGTFWYYNNWDFNTSGFIYEQAVGKSIFASFEEEIAKPIGMEDFRVKDGSYVRGPETKYPAYVTYMSARDLARFALLFLHQGNWNGKQIVPAAWVVESTRPYSDTSSGGYGYMWWTGDSATARNEPKYPFPAHSYWLEGNLGQYAIVVPQLDLIIVNRVDGSETEKKVNKRMMSELVSLILDAAPKR